MKAFTWTLLLVVSTTSFADEPLGPPTEIRRCDAAMNYCLYADPNGDTTVYKVEGRFETTQLYVVAGWHRSPWVSSSGRYLVTEYDGLNLLPLDVSPDETVLSIYDQGALIRQIKLRELFHSLDSLRRTASHYHWGSVDLVTDDAIWLTTTEGEVVVDITDDTIYLPDSQEPAESE
jgi:hypothetical protein